MRKIEFRAVAKNKKRWVYGDLIHDGTGYSIIEHSGGCIKVRPETIGEYTGLKDPNGKRIFEGDILKVISKESATDNQNHYDYVVFSDGCFCMANAFMFEELSYGCDYDVVGNIHDNKELLEEEDGNN